MKKQYLIDLTTSLAVWCGDTVPVLTSTNAKCGSDIFLCYNENNSMAFEADEVTDFAQNKYRVAGQGLVVDPSRVEPDNSQSLAQARLKKIEEIKLFRDNRVQNGGYKVGEHWYHSDTFSRTQQMALVMYGANMPNGIMWKTMENGYLPMTPTLAMQIFGAAAMSDQINFTCAATHMANVLASNNPESYDYSANWSPSLK